jgi:hypothetical protein
MPSPLFSQDNAPDAGYRNIRAATNGRLYLARCHCEYLWIFFERHADAEFRKELGSSFSARYWEMYLTTSFILAGYSVTCPKPGPDVGIVLRGKRIWFEAVSPTPGRPGSPDFIQQPKSGEVSDVPNEKIVLRYLNSISEKYERQYTNWLEKGHVSKDDAFVIALNPRNIPFDYADTQPPRILQAAYTMGPSYVVIDRETMKAVATGYHFRDHIVKTPDSSFIPDGETKEPAKVTTGIFQDRQHDRLSALLCSRVDAANHHGEMGDDFQLLPNPRANVPLPESFRLRGTYYAAKLVEDGYQVTPTQDGISPVFG